VVKEKSMFTYVMTLQCTDRPGIVRATSTAIVEVGGNILENDQFTDPVTNQFCMRER
jgi:formyltetrahydrofolate deformylase